MALQKSTLLLIDGDGTLAGQLTRAVKAHFPGCSVMHAGSLDEAETFARHTPPDCVVMYWQGAVDIAGTCARLEELAENPFPVLIALNAGADEKLELTLLRECADDILPVPFSEKELVARLRVVFRIKRGEDELRAANKRLAKLASNRTVALRGSEERYRMLFDVNHDGVVLFGIDPVTKKPGLIREANARACELVGYSVGEMCQQSVMDLLHPDRNEAAALRMESVMTHRQVVFDTIFVKKSGQPLPAEIHARLLFEEDPPQVLAVCRSLVDLDAPILHETDPANRLQIVADHMGQVVYEYDMLEGSIRWIGPVKRLTGYDSKELDGVNFNKLVALVHPEDRDQFRRTIEDAVASLGVYHTQYRLLHKSGVYRYIEDEGLAMPDEEGRAYRVLGSAKDVTARALADRQRQKYEREMQHSQRLESLGVLAGGIAHDFNNILAAIIGLTDMAVQDLDPQSATHADLKESLQAAHRAKELVKQILAFSRQTSEQRVPLYLHVIIREALKLCRATLPANIQIIDNIDVHSGVVEADAAQMHQVFMNFCTNAAAAMLDSGGTIEVILHDVELDERGAAVHPKLHRGPYVLLAVADSGHGMAPKILKRIFDPFFTTKGPGEGTGMGLSVVHGIITNHGGVVMAESAPGEGSTFTVYLPRAVTPVFEDPTVITQLPTAQGRVLFVDDEGAVRRFGAAALKRMGYEAVVAANGEEALRLFQEAPDSFDVLVTDQVMPKMSGDELVTALREIRPELPAILFTGFGERITEQKAEQAGISEIVTKPVVARELDAAIRRALLTIPKPETK